MKTKFFFLAWLCLVLSTAHAVKSAPAKASAPKTSEEQAIFAGGCFWSMEPPFVELKGVKKTLVGYTGGKKDKPTYEEVSEGTTGHVEAVQITFDPKVTTYENLLDVFWRSQDPTDDRGQFADRGSQYQSEIFYTTTAQKAAAEASKITWDKSGKFKKPIVTKIVAGSRFWPAEDYHQHYYEKNPSNYHRCHWGSGRGTFLQGIWGSTELAKEHTK